MKNKLLALALMFFILPFVSAELNEYAPVAQNECVTLKQSCGSCTYVNASLSYPNSSWALENVGMGSVGGGAWEYDFCNTTDIGRYDIIGSGDLEGTATSFDSVYFEVTRLGGKLGDIGVALTWVLFMLAVIGNVSFLILTLVKLVTARETVFGLLTAWAFYGLMIIVYFLSGLMTTEFIATVSDFFLIVFVWSNGVLPAISLIITMIVKGTQKKKPINVAELTGRQPLGNYGQ